MTGFCREHKVGLFLVRKPPGKEASPAWSPTFPFAGWSMLGRERWMLWLQVSVSDGSPLPAVTETVISRDKLNAMLHLLMTMSDEPAEACTPQQHHSAWCCRTLQLLDLPSPSRDRNGAHHVNAELVSHWHPFGRHSHRDRDRAWNRLFVLYFSRGAGQARCQQRASLQSLHGQLRPEPATTYRLTGTAM
jgi:hypothetical protein